MDSKAIYQSKMIEASVRFRQSHIYMAEVKSSHSQFAFESCVLQLRKVLECIAPASIAPNQKAYVQFRISSEKPSDFRKDFNGKAIVKMLGKVNPDFYPIPVIEGERIDRHIHFTRRADNYLTMENFEALYDRLGKFLHSDNPWGNDKQVNNFIQDSHKIFESIFYLLDCYFTTIRSPEFNGIWLINLDLATHTCRVRVGEAPGEFCVSK